MSININSEAACRKAYLNYHCYGNTMGISTKQMSEITARWESRLSSWQTTVSNDENQYEFDDSEFKDYKANGKAAAMDATGYDGDQSGQKRRVTNDVVTAGGTAVVSLGAQKIFKKAAEKAAEKAVMKAGEKAVKKASEEAITAAGKESIKKAAKEAALEAAEESGKTLSKKALNAVADKAVETTTDEAIKTAGEESIKKAGEESCKTTAKSAGQSIGCIVGCVAGAATAAAYFIKKPNKEEKDACDDMQTELTNAQGALAAEQENMQTMGEEIIALSDEAAQANEDANAKIVDTKTDYDMYKSTYEALKTRAQSGQVLSDDEKALYKTVTGHMASAGEEINNLSEGTGETVDGLYSDMETYQEGYDYAAETIGEIEGQTDFAASFDKSTQTMCYVEGGAQTLNSFSSFKSGVQAFSLATSGSWAFGATAWAYAFAAMGFAASASSGLAAAEQFTWAGDVGKEIDIRKQTEDLNAETLDVYTEEVDSYAGWMQGVDDLELEIPNDIEAPQDTALPETKTPTDKTDDKKDKKEKEK